MSNKTITLILPIADELFKDFVEYSKDHNETVVESLTNLIKQATGNKKPKRVKLKRNGTS